MPTASTGLVNRVKELFGGTEVQKDHVVMDVSRITDQIFVGTNTCCQQHYREKLLDEGILHELSVEGERVDTPYGVESYLWLPTPDKRAPVPLLIDLGVAYIQNVLQHGGRVFVHCTNGHGRAPTIAAAWFISQGMSVDDAIETIRTGRAEIHLEPAQRTALKEYAARLRATAGLSLP